MPRFAPLLITTAILAAAATQSGCLSDASRKKAADSGSIFDAFGPPTPAEAAAMMASPYDADKRYKGVTWISNAPWGGADVYLVVYREMVANEKEDAGVRAVAARALAMHGSSADAVLIAPLLGNDDKRVRQTAARALQRVSNPAVIPDLIHAVDSGERATIRIITTDTEAAATLARTGLVPSAAQPSPIDPQKFAAVAAAVSKDQWASSGGLATEQVSTYTTAFPAALRTIIARAPEGSLTQVIPTGTGQYVFALVDKKHPGEVDRDVRQSAASALGQYADPRVLDALIGALNDDEFAVARTARQSLRTLTGHDAGDEPKDWQAWLTGQTAPFTGQTTYRYPNFERGKYFWEYIPLVPPPPNEPTSTPIGYRPPGA